MTLQRARSLYDECSEALRQARKNPDCPRGWISSYEARLNKLTEIIERLKGEKEQKATELPNGNQTTSSGTPA
jgi:exonuclease VII small subunit